MVRKIGLMLCISMMAATLPTVNGQNLEFFFTSLVDRAYPFEQEEVVNQEDVSVNIM